MLTIAVGIAGLIAWVGLLRDTLKFSRQLRARARRAEARGRGPATE